MHDDDGDGDDGELMTKQQLERSDNNSFGLRRSVGPNCSQAFRVYLKVKSNLSDVIFPPDVYVFWADVFWHEINASPVWIDSVLSFFLVLSFFFFFFISL